jgi:hypothetical protein
MRFIQINSNAIVALDDIRLTGLCVPDNPVSLSEFGYEKVTEVPKPEAAFNQEVLDKGVKFVDGLWRQTWLVCELDVDRYADKLAKLKLSNISRIDAEADAIIRDCIGERATQYQRAEAQARSHVANQSGPVPNMIAALMPIKNQTALQVAREIIAQADAWVIADNAIYSNRISAKEIVRNASDDVAANSGLTAWTQFRNAIRSQLGV